MSCFCLAGREPRGQGIYGPENPGARDQAWDPKRAHGPAQAPDRALFWVPGPWGPWPRACTRVLCMHKRSLVYAQEILLCIHNKCINVTSVAMLRSYAKLCETMRNYTKLYETTRSYPKLCETIRNYAKLWKLDAQFRANVSICTRLRIESSLPEFASGASGNGVTERCSDPPFSRAGG